jgi:hypothetical protein
VTDRACYVGAPAIFLLNQACMLVNRAFDATCYLVGSSMQTREYRDVDVRLILDDAQYDHLFPGATGRAPQTNAFWSLICSAVSEHLARITGLPVDFQVQRRTQANEQYNGRRSALGIYPDYGGGPDRAA